MYISKRIKDEKHDVCRIVFKKLLNCSDDELDEEIQYQGIDFDEISELQLYNLIVEYDIDI